MKKHTNPNNSQFDEPSIKRRDIRNLLQAYSGAIALDQFKVDALPRKHFHRYYRRGLWVIWRKSHLSFIDKLVATTGAIPRKLLSDLTVLAARRDPLVVRKTMVEILVRVLPSHSHQGISILQPYSFKLWWYLSAMGALSPATPTANTAKLA
jgi:hypothetical protein